MPDLIVRTCTACGAKNRVPARHLADAGRCGACKAVLAPIAEPDGTQAATRRRRRATIMPTKLFSLMKRPAFVVSIMATTLVAGGAIGQPHHGGPGRAQGMMSDPEGRADMQVFRFLLDHRAEIRRTVREVAGGVETVTESDNPEIAARIQEHVAAMYRRLKESRPIHSRDPLFAELFRHADKITMKSEKTRGGLRVTETSRDPYVTRLIRSHADVVTAFLKNGHPEMMKSHPLPGAAIDTN
jgi:hypothetical protein